MNTKMRLLAEDLQVKGVLLLNVTQDRVLFEMNADTTFPFASITKIMTSMLAIRKAAKPEDVRIEMENRSIEDVRNEQPALTFTCRYVGEHISLLDYLYGCLLESGCEAAQQIAYYVGDGSMERFIEQANDLAHEIGCENTKLIDPTGLYDIGHYSTPRDISKILLYAMADPIFRRIVSSSRYKTGCFSDILTSTNLLLLPQTDTFFPYAVGGKTGFTHLAGRCLACWFERGGQEYILVALGYPPEASKCDFYRQFVSKILCCAFEAEGDFMRVLLPEHIHRAQPGDRFILTPEVIDQNCDVVPRMSFLSADEQIASVDQDGCVTVHAQGFTQIEVLTQTGDYDICFVDSRESENDTVRRIRTPQAAACV